MKLTKLFNENHKPLVSICCIVYNQIDFLDECLQGFEMQTVNFDLEIVIHDDFSIDGSRQRLIKFKEQSKFPVHLILPEENTYSKGEKIFLKTFKKADGKYIAMCEGDDYWTDPLKLQKQVDFLEANSQYSYCGHKSSSLKNGIIKQIPLEIKTLNFSKLIFKNYLNTATLLFRSNSIKDLPDFYSNVSAGDWALQLIAIKESQAYILSDYMSVYREQERGLWSNLDRETKCLKGTDLMNKISVIYSKKSERKMIRKAIKMRKESFGILKPSMLNRLKKKLS